MPEKNPQCSAVDQSESDLPSSHCRTERPTGPPVGGRKNADSGQKNGETSSSSSSPESGSLNGEGKRLGKSRRRRKRGSCSESRPEGSPADSGPKEEAKPADGHSALLALQSECGAVWFQCSVYERAESRYRCWLACSSARPGQPPPPRRPTEKPVPLSVPNTLTLPANPAAAPLTPDEGYHSQAPTPAAPAPVPPAGRQPVNGLPRLPLELLRDVWLEKPVYDRAEAAFYQNLCSNNSSSKWPGSLSACRSAERPHSLAEEVEEEELPAEEESRAPPQGKAEAFHALHPIQEEEEPSEITEEAYAGVLSFCLHPGSERVWLDRCRYDAAESRFYRHHCQCTAAASEGDNTMSAVAFLAQEKIWFEKPRYDEAERHFYERVTGPSQPAQDVGANSILQDIARARENIQKSLAGLKSTLFNRGSGQLPPSHQPHFGSSSGAGDQEELVSRMKSLELENQSLHKVVDDLRAALSKLECRVAVLEKCPAVVTPALAMPCTNGNTCMPQKNSSLATDKKEDDDDFDLFGSDEEDDPEAERMKEQRLKEYAEKKAKKPAIIAKSSILLDVKPWDDETDMAKLEECVRSIQADGLLWGTSKMVPVGYGINKLQIACVVEDDKVGTDLLEEEITKFDEYVQSVDVAAFNKI